MAHSARENKFYCVDGLDTLREYVAWDSIDLIHFDPLFNSNGAHAVLIQKKDGEKSTAHMNSGHVQESVFLTKHSRQSWEVYHA
jgi:hypothetical protein